MKVGDLVTLSASGLQVERIRSMHINFFGGRHRWSGRLMGENRNKFVDYWDNRKMVGLITSVRREPIQSYDWRKREYVTTGEDIIYHVAWQANPKGMGSAHKHIRSHLKFVKKGKVTK